MKTYFILLFLFLLSCSGGSIKPDPTMGSMDANYPTVEFLACGNIWHGLGVCPIKKGQTMSDINLEIQGYYNGTIKVVSDCGFNENKRYKDSEKISLRSSEPAKSCIISFVVSPEYPKEEKTPVVVRSLSGYLAVSAIEDGDDFSGYVSKIKQGTDSSIFIDADQGDRRVVFKGCGKSYDRTITSVGGLIEIQASDVMGPIGITQCPLSGGISNDTTKYITWMIWGYHGDFQPLSDPVVKVSKNKLTLIADPTVSVVSVGNLFKIGSSATFKIDKDKTYILRAVTVSGRTAIGLYKNGVVKWVK